MAGLGVRMVSIMAALRDKYCDCPGGGLADDQHASECFGLDVRRTVEGLLMEALS